MTQRFSGAVPAITFQSPRRRLPRPSTARVWGRQAARSATGASTAGGGNYALRLRAYLAPLAAHTLPVLCPLFRPIRQFHAAF
jgi:hypothetical protein